MAHICPNCFEQAPILFKYCPECDFDMIGCLNMERAGYWCDHCFSTRNQMIMDGKKGVNVAKTRYYTIHTPGRDGKRLLSRLLDDMTNCDNSMLCGTTDNFESAMEGATHYIENRAHQKQIESFMVKIDAISLLAEEKNYPLAKEEIANLVDLFNEEQFQKILDGLKDVKSF